MASQWVFSMDLFTSVVILLEFEVVDKRGFFGSGRPSGIDRFSDDEDVASSLDSPPESASSFMRCLSHLRTTSARSTASFLCSSVAVGVNPSRWIDVTMYCTK